MIPPKSAHPEEPHSGVSKDAPISARDVIETAVALTAAALFGAAIAIVEGWL